MAIQRLRCSLYTPMYFCFTTKTRSGFECCPSGCSLGVGNIFGLTFDFNRGPVTKLIVAPHLGLDYPPRRCRTSSRRHLATARQTSELHLSSSSRPAHRQPRSPIRCLSVFQTLSATAFMFLLKVAASWCTPHAVLQRLPDVPWTDGHFASNNSVALWFPSASRAPCGVVLFSRPSHVPLRARLVPVRASTSLPLLPSEFVPFVALTHFHWPSNSSD